MILSEYVTIVRNSEKDEALGDKGRLFPHSVAADE